ncbi:phosphate ABC transporter, periplasmic phosphate-binding protein [Acidovorax delafieldii 2AN]|uniref:Phosphate-binding protein PstS n=1 Tax=Acidovorax delafieldii 2AN TaxID=573060 RepID=C5T602_ACIDE|nr:phosphate ABC transporter substrate-binding protein PstS [Acidovorax delafieldii]EER60097.1 phosphate ABC transporter, periplasmic phosphate-binding protein [Acidovorax delafieldii 2AN]
MQPLFRSRIALIMAPLIAGLSWIAPAHAQETLTLRGAGASFPAKVYAQWASQYAQERGTKVQYAAVGSTQGVRQIKAQQVDFGATDVPLSPQDLAQHNLIQFPTLVGGVVPIVNLPGVASGQLRLDAQALAAIFAGRIEQWNDKAIAALNPEVKLPNLPITRVVRADGSGTTEVLLAYLRKAAPAVATSTAIPFTEGRAAWPAGGPLQAVEGSGKVVAAVQATAGALGYVSSDYVVGNGPAAVTLRNRRGEWVTPSLTSYRAAVRGANLFKDGLNAPPLVDLDTPMAWPIVSATYIVIDSKPAAPERTARALNFFYRSFLMGDRAVAGTGFAPLPVETQARVVALLNTVRTPDGKPLPVMGEAAEGGRAALR